MASDTPTSPSRYSSRYSQPPAPPRPPKQPQEITCPLCSDYTADDEYIIQLHIEAVHDKQPAPSSSQLLSFGSSATGAGSGPASSSSGIKTFSRLYQKSQAASTTPTSPGYIPPTQTSSKEHRSSHGNPSRAPTWSNDPPLPSSSNNNGGGGSGKGISTTKSIQQDLMRLYDPFKYQVPNNNSQEIVGAPQWADKPSFAATAAAAHVASTPATTSRESERKSSTKSENRPTRGTDTGSGSRRHNDATAAAIAATGGYHQPPSVETNDDADYVTCEWKDCGELIGLMQLESHLAMHEELAQEEAIASTESETAAAASTSGMITEDDDNYDIYDDDTDTGDDLGRDSVYSGARERKGDAMMDRADKKRGLGGPRKDGPSSRVPKKSVQMERRLESEALVVEGDKLKRDDAAFDEDGEDDDGSTSREYDIINKDEIPDDFDGKGGVSAAAAGRSKEKDKDKDKDKGGTRSGKSRKEEGSGGRKIRKQYGGYGSSSGHSSRKSNRPKFKKAELGPYANEKKMPDWLRDALTKGPKEILTRTITRDGKIALDRHLSNETSGLVPVISQLLSLDPNVQKAYLCHRSVKHVFKEHPGANGFCGYRNIMMLLSYCQKVPVAGCERFYDTRLPTVIQLQQWIEAAWDMGINAHARQETGGILHTRKYIGSSEVEAMLTSFGARTNPQCFAEPNPLLNALKHVWEYFASPSPPEGAAVEDDDEDDFKVIRTDKPPIYLQHVGHSMTIIGVEKAKDGTLGLLVLDPMFNPTTAVKGLVGQRRIKHIAHAKMLKQFRRGVAELKKFSIFEMVELVPEPEPEISLYE